MKIAKLTWLHNNNYGSILQALALQKFITNQGYDIIDLNYKASLKTKLLNWVQNRNSLKVFIGKIKEFKYTKQNDYSDKFDTRNKNIEKFKNDNMKISRLCRTPKDLADLSKEYDVFLCGSDQIWSPALMNPVFYFSFVPEEKIKISYAPSFGVTNTTNFKKERIKKYLKKFKNISVREEQGQQLVMELIGKKVPVLVDPTLLLTKEEWVNYTNKKFVFEKPYIFCYLLSENKKYIENIRKFASEKKLEVVIIPNQKGPFNTGFKEIIDAGPTEWLTLLKNSQYVFTDSFHGGIFSLIFQKEFILYKRFSDKGKYSENSRVYNLTNLLGLKERLIDEDTLCSIDELKKINYEKINKIIKREAMVSKEWLINALNESE